MEYITVDRDRYGGIYSGSAWTAWIGEAPSGVGAGDGCCREFWENNKITYGAGDGASEAVQNLLAKEDGYIGLTLTVPSSAYASKVQCCPVGLILYLNHGLIFAASRFITSGLSANHSFNSASCSALTLTSRKSLTRYQT